MPDVAKVELVGVQDEKIFIELSPKQAGRARHRPGADRAGARSSRTRSPAPAAVETRNHAVPLRVTGQLDSVERGRATCACPRQRPRRSAWATSPTVTRGYVDPPIAKMRFQGKEAIGLGVSMARAATCCKLGEDLEARRWRSCAASCRSASSSQQVSDQPRGGASCAVGEFVRALIEAVAIVLVVSLPRARRAHRPGGRADDPAGAGGDVPRHVLFGIGLHKISLGALIIALGLLVDDAIIAVEMMARKLEQGFDKLARRDLRLQTTAFPMLTGTLITAAGFLPIATAQVDHRRVHLRHLRGHRRSRCSSPGSRRSTATPFLGAWLLQGAQDRRGRASTATSTDTPFYTRAARRWSTWCIVHRRDGAGRHRRGCSSLGVGAACASPQKQFFPASAALELMVDLWLPEGRSFAATERSAAQLEALLAKDQDVESFVDLRRHRLAALLPAARPAAVPQPTSRSSCVLTKDMPARERVRERLRRALDDRVPRLRGRVMRVPLTARRSDYPMQFRVSGEDGDAAQIADAGGGDGARQPRRRATSTSTGTSRSQAMRVEIDQDKARALGVTSARRVAARSHAIVSGVHDRPVPRARQAWSRSCCARPPPTRGSLDILGELPVTHRLAARRVPLAQVARRLRDHRGADPLAPQPR